MYDNNIPVKRENRDHPLSIRIPERLFKVLEKQAESERRSIADVVNITLEDRFAAAAKERGRQR